MIFQQYFILLQLHLSDDSQMLFLLMLQCKIQLLHLKDICKRIPVHALLSVKATHFINCSLSAAVRVSQLTFLLCISRQRWQWQTNADGRAVARLPRVHVLPAVLCCVLQPVLHRAPCHVLQYVLSQARCATHAACFFRNSYGQSYADRECRRDSKNKIGSKGTHTTLSNLGDILVRSSRSLHWPGDTYSPQALYSRTDLGTGSKACGFRFACLTRTNPVVYLSLAGHCIAGCRDVWCCQLGIRCKCVDCRYALRNYPEQHGRQQIA